MPHRNDSKNDGAQDDILRYQSLKTFLVWLTISLILVAVSCQAISETPDNLPQPIKTPSEIAVIEILLNGEAAKATSEISGLAWFGETLVLLPQYPERFKSSADGVLFAISKSDILERITDGRDEAITPEEIVLVAPGLNDQITGFEGFEALAFDGEAVYLTIEAKQGNRMMGYILRGEIASDQSQIQLDLDSLSENPPQVQIDNMTDEALLVLNHQLYTFFEANGSNVNPGPVAHLFDPTLTEMTTQPFLNLEYRLTDVTALDEAGIFWGINYLYPSEIAKIDPADDPLIAQFGEGLTHDESQVVERLVEFQIRGDQIALTNTAPIQLKLLDGNNPRNWEGIVRLDDLGFLIVTDKYPETILGFVPYP